MLAVLVVTSALAAVGAALLARRERDPAHAAAPLFRPRRALVIGAALGLAAVAVAVAGAAQEERRVQRPAVTGATAERLTSLESKRYGYWRVAADAFAGDPLIGIGAGGFAVEWLRERDEPDAARDAHSIYVETAAELGLVGLLALALFAGGSLVAAGRALASGSPVAVGAAAAAATWAVHAGLDWDWEMPAVTLPALVLVGALIATSDARHDTRASAPDRAPADAPPAPEQHTVSA
jgi:O-antigen ligase